MTCAHAVMSQLPLDVACQPASLGMPSPDTVAEQLSQLIVEIYHLELQVGHCVAETTTSRAWYTAPPRVAPGRSRVVVLLSCLSVTEPVLPMFARAIMHVQ